MITGNSGDNGFEAVSDLDSPEIADEVIDRL